MKKIKMLICFFLVSSCLTTTNAQSQYGEWGKAGIFLKLSDDLAQAKTGGFEIFKKSGNTQTLLRKVTAPLNKSDFEKRLKYFNRFLPDYKIPRPKMIDRLWNSFIKNNVLDSLYFWGTMPLVQLSIGVMFLDTTAVENNVNSYLIKYLDEVGNKIKGDNSIVTEYKNKAQIGKIKFETTHIQESSLTLSYFVEKGYPSSVKVFRRNDLAEPFEQIKPTIGFRVADEKLNITIMDATIDSGAIYQYFVTPVDRFNLEGGNSDTTFCGVYDFSSARPPILKVESVDSLYGILVSWRGNYYPFVKSIKLFRSDIFDSLFVEVAELSPSSYSYLDNFVEPMKKYFYKIQYVGILGETSFFSPRLFGYFLDTTKPDAPINLTAENVTEGVKLIWESDEEFLKGFYVSRNNGSTDEMKQISLLLPVADSLNLFIDSTNLYSKFTYAYSIVAENTSHVQSRFSDTVYISVIDISKLLPPLNIVVKRNNKFAKLYWDDMRKFNAQIKGYKVFRKTSGAEFIPLTDTLLWNNQNNFDDKSVIIGTEYEYAVKSYSFSKTESEFSSSKLFKIDFPIPLPPSNVTGAVKENGIEINWLIFDDTNLEEVNLYRAKRGEKEQLIKKINDLKQTEFIDTNVKNGEFYFYYLNTQSKDGIKSKSSKEIGVQY